VAGLILELTYLACLPILRFNNEDGKTKCFGLLIFLQKKTSKKKNTVLDGP